MLIPNNPDLDFSELNRRIDAEMQRYQRNAGEPFPAFNANPPQPADQPYAWAALVQLEDAVLVKAAFPSLLARKATVSEASYWLAQLRSGVDRFEFLATLRYSKEGKRVGAPVQGLRRARVKSALRHSPLLGRLLANAYGLAMIDTRHRHYLARFDLQSRQLEQHRQALSLNEARASQAVANAQAQHQALNLQLAKINTVLEDYKQQLSRSQQVAQELRARLSHLERSNTSTTRQDDARTNSQPSASSCVPDSFYLAFEERFRGDASTIRDRLSYYLPLLELVHPLTQGLPLVDVGCGRGEWLQLLPENYKRIGIDLNSANIETCKAKGFDAEVGDGISWLGAQPDNSVAAVTAFHVIEHLSFEQLNGLIDECLRVLAPGGMIIFETPNPENIVSAATHFYTDPTHIHPLPPAFTEFLVEFKGFDAVEIHRLNPIPAEYSLHEDSEVARRCNALFYSAQDYSVIARKSLS